MKLFFILSFCLFASGAYSRDHKEMKGKTFEEKKQMMSTYLDKKLETLQKTKSCVNGAKDDAALRKCKEEKREAMKGMKKHKKHKKQKEEAHERKEKHEVINDQVDRLDE